METYEKYIGEATPYSGIHINHKSSVAHIQKVYGTEYKVVFSPSTSLYYVQGKMANGEWVPVTTGFADKSVAEEFAAKLSKANMDQKKMVGTIT